MGKVILTFSIEIPSGMEVDIMPGGRYVVQGDDERTLIIRMKLKGDAYGGSQEGEKEENSGKANG